LQNSHITSLHNELKDVRQAYLSTAQARKTHLRSAHNQQRTFTDIEREEIDANAKKMLRELNASIRGLDEVELLRRETEAAIIRKKYVRDLGALGNWAVGGGDDSRPKSEEHAAAETQARDIGLHRDGILWFLRRQLQLCGKTQQDMMEARLTREMEKNRSVLAKAGDFGRFNSSSAGQERAQITPRPQNPPVHQEPKIAYNSYDIGEDLTEEQIQMFERDNQDMLKHYQGTLDKVRYVHSSSKQTNAPLS
jgi:syntaxin 18